MVVASTTACSVTLGLTAHRTQLDVLRIRRESSRRDREMVGIEGHIREVELAAGVGLRAAVQAADGVVNFNRGAHYHGAGYVDDCAVQRGRIADRLRTRNPCHSAGSKQQHEGCKVQRIRDRREPKVRLKGQAVLFYQSYPIVFRRPAFSALIEKMRGRYGVCPYRPGRGANVALEVEAHFSGKGSRCDVMRAAKRRKEVVQRVFVGRLMTVSAPPLVLVLVEKVVVADGDIK